MRLTDDEMRDVFSRARRPEETSARTKLYITLLGSGVGIGALVGSLLTALLGR